MALFEGHARACGHIAVAGGVHNGLREDRLTAGLALNDNAAHRVAVFDDRGHVRMEQQLHARLLHHVEDDFLVHLAVDDGGDGVVAVAQLLLEMPIAAARGLHPLNEFRRDPAHDLDLTRFRERFIEIEVAVQRPCAVEQRPAKIAVALDEDHARRYEPRRAPRSFPPCRLPRPKRRR